MRYVLYARKSSESEDRQVQSIDAQLAVLRRFAAERGMDVVRELTETGSAKAEGTRPIFIQMLRLLKTGGADGVLCWSINRLSRNPEDSGRLAGLLQRGEIQAIQTPERCYRPEDNVLLWAVEAGMANQDIVDLRRNTAWGMAAKVEKGWFPHLAPQGYHNDKHLEQGQRTISRDPERFVLIQSAFEMLLSGNHSVNRVYRVLTEEWSYRTPVRRRSGGAVLSRSAFYGMARNVFYAGYFMDGGELRKGAHEPMITLAQFHQLQTLLGREGAPRSRREIWAYTGLIRCAHCGGLVTAEVKRKPSGKAYRYYHCNGGPCRRYHVREEVLEACLEKAMEAITLDKEAAALVRQGLVEWGATQNGARLAAQEARQRALSSVQSRLDTLLDAMLTGLVTGEEYVAKKRELQAEKAVLTEELEQNSNMEERDREAVCRVVGFHEQSLSLFAAGDPLSRRSLARLLATGYVLERGVLQIDLNPVLQPLLQAGLTRGEGWLGCAGSKTIVPLRCGGSEQKNYGQENNAEEPGSGSFESHRNGPALQNRTLKSGFQRGKSVIFSPLVQCGAPNHTLTEQTSVEQISLVLNAIAQTAAIHSFVMAEFA